MLRLQSQIRGVHKLILAVVGSVEADLDETITVIGKYVKLLKPTLLLSGGAEGVDTHMKVYAVRENIPFFELKPVNRSFHAECGFKVRNMLVAFNCDKLLRIVSKRSRTYGSGYTRDRAREFGKEVFEETVS
jgi:hypothetical protein